MLYFSRRIKICLQLNIFILFGLWFSTVTFANQGDESLSQLGGNLNGIMMQLIHLVCLFSLVIGSVLFVMGLFALYARLIKKKSNGKPVSNHVVMTLVGLVFVGTPLLFQVTSGLTKNNSALVETGNQVKVFGGYD